MPELPRGECRSTAAVGLAQAVVEPQPVGAANCQASASKLCPSREAGAPCASCLAKSNVSQLPAGRQRRAESMGREYTDP